MEELSGSNNKITSHESLKSKRKRITQACDFCRVRHLKCDGEKLCYQCKTREIACVYSKKKKRGPKNPKRKGSDPKVERFENSSHGALNPSPVGNGVVFAENGQSSYAVVYLDIFQGYCLFGRNTFDVDPKRADEFMQLLSSEEIVGELEYLRDAFVWAVVFTYGAHLRGDRVVAEAYQASGMEMLKRLVYSEHIMSNMACQDNTFLDAITSFGKYHSFQCQYSKSRTIHSIALSMVQMFEYPADLTIRVYSFFMVSAADIKERLKWFEMAMTLTNDLTIFGRMHVVLALTCDLDTTHQNITSVEVVNNKPEEVKFMKEAINYIDGTEDTLSSVIQLGGIKSENELSRCKCIIYGIRAIMYAKLGLQDIALSWATETLETSKNVNLAISDLCYISVIFAVSTSLICQTTDLYEQYASSLAHLTQQWPVYNRISVVLNKLYIFTTTQKQL